MAESRTAYRYALAMIGAAEEQKALDQVTEDLETIERLSGESRDFLLFLRSPVIKADKKRGVLTALLQKQASKVTMRFIDLLVVRGRETILPEIIRQFYRLRDQRSGIENAVVKSAVPLSDDQERQIATRLEQITKKKVRIVRKVDPQVGGGLAVQIGDTVWDGTVAHQLDVLRRRFIEGTHAGS